MELFDSAMVRVTVYGRMDEREVQEIPQSNWTSSSYGSSGLAQKKLPPTLFSFLFFFSQQTCIQV